MTAQEAIRSTIARLEGGAASPRPEAEELVGRLLGVRRMELYRKEDRALSADEAGTLERWIERRLGGEPIQYITGRAAFRDLDLNVSPAVLVPRPETEGLVERAIEVLRGERERWLMPRVLDLGTGSGAIALAIAQEWPTAMVTATDESAAALEVARGNAETLGLAGRVRLLEGNWFAAVGAEERFEIVISNPPYISEGERDALPGDVRDHEPARALFAGPTGLEALWEIVDHAPRHLVTGGLLALELAEARAEDMFTWIQGNPDWEGVRLERDLADRPRILLARSAP